MREIKFKALNANKEWVYGLIQKDAEGSTKYYNEMPYRMCWFEGTAHCNQPVITDTIVQFTGLHDKNGVEIYEGDIVKFNDHTSFVIFSNIHSGFVFNSYMPKGYIHNLYYVTEEGGEVIGNIYENPELL